MGKKQKQKYFFGGKIFFESAILIFFCFFPLKQVKVYWLARMGQNFDQANHDDTFRPMPNILKVSLC